jgi:sugar O-acyltransferase (sialic acid O-acetyltransferase NeuD family)
MIRYQILGQSNYAVAILLDVVRQLHEGPITAEIVSNIPSEENESLSHSYQIEGIQTREVSHAEWSRDEAARLLIGSIGRGREKIYRFFKDRFGIETVDYDNAIHPRAITPLSFDIGHGVHLGPGVTIAPHSQLGDFVVVNRSASVGHHTMVDDFVTLNPGSHVAGICHLEHGVILGAGATVVDGITVGRGSQIGAGSVVTRGIPAGVVAYGVPAKVIRER